MAKSKKSVLAKQRPKKGRKKGGFFQNNAKLILLSLTILTVLGGTIWFVLTPSSRTVSGKTRDWKLTIRSEDKSLLEGAEEKAIIEAVKAHVTTGERRDLIRAVSSVKAMDVFARVHMVRTGDDTITLYYAKRVPVMCYQNDASLYLVSNEAEIYGQAANVESCPGPVLSGIFEERKSRQVKHNVIVLTSEELKNVQTALQLITVLEKHKHQASNISYEKYRGFYINLKDLETDIAIGNPPFEPKLEKLGEVLEKIRSKGEVAQRIELDFQGKAFIKMKKT